MRVRRRPRTATPSIVIISGSCCIPGMAPFDEQAERVVQEAIARAGIQARVLTVPASKAMFGVVPRKVMGELMAEANNGQMPLPAVLVNGAIVSCGVPTVDQMTAALLGDAAVITNEKE